MIFIRNIETAEAEKFWQLRLEALRTNPEAFGSTYEEASSAPLEKVQERLLANDHQYTLGAYTAEGKLVGMAGFKREAARKMAHKSFIWGMYVTPAYRKHGIGRMLMEEILRRAGRLPGLEQINLSVVTSNERALKLYLALGFETFGLEKNALKHNGIHYDEEHMVFWLDKGLASGEVPS